jgi:hypothetical protein
MKARGAGGGPSYILGYLFRLIIKIYQFGGKKNPFEICQSRPIFSMKSFWYKLKLCFLGQNLAKIH